MNTRVASSAIKVVRAELDRESSSLDDEGYAEWRHYGEPPIRDLCLAILVAVHHQLEKELLQLAAKTTSDGRELSYDQYRQRIQEERKEFRKKEGRQTLVARLKLDGLDDWRSMETLRLLANSYKHNPEASPDNDLLKHLDLELGAPYAPLTESDAIENALLLSLGLNDDANFCDIADELLSRAERFLAAATQAQPILSKVGWRPLSIDPGAWPR